LCATECVSACVCACVCACECVCEREIEKEWKATNKQNEVLNCRLQTVTNLWREGKIINLIANNENKVWPNLINTLSYVMLCGYSTIIIINLPLICYKKDWL